MSNTEKHTIEKLQRAYARGYEEDGIAYILCKETNLLFTTSYYLNTDWEHPENKKEIISYKYCPHCGKEILIKW